MGKLRLKTMKALPRSWGIMGGCHVLIQPLVTSLLQLVPPQGGNLWEAFFPERSAFEMAGQLVMARFHWIPGFLAGHGGGGGSQPPPGRSFSPSHGSWCLQAPMREDKECGPAADPSPPRPLAQGGPAGSVPGSVLPLHSLPGPLRSSAHSRNSWMGLCVHPRSWLGRAPIEMLDRDISSGSRRRSAHCPSCGRQVFTLLLACSVIWERAGALVSGRMSFTLLSGVMARATGTVVAWSLPGALFSTLSLC